MPNSKNETDEGYNGEYRPDESDTIKKEVAREIVIAIAQGIVANGITELDCGKWVLSGGIAGCCEAWNRLIRAVRECGNVFDEANAVLAAFTATG